jgi:hypothetical protein
MLKTTCLKILNQGQISLMKLHKSPGFQGMQLLISYLKPNYYKITCRDNIVIGKIVKKLSFISFEKVKKL